MNKQALTTLYNRASAGDPAARALVSHAMERVHQGDRKAQIVVGALKQIHDERSQTRNAILARDLYTAIRRGDSRARQKLGHIVQGAKQGRPSAQRAFQMLQGIHLQEKAVGWRGPGSPRTGHYPMPSTHRVGIYVPGLGDIPVPNMPSIPGYQPTPPPQPSFLPLTPQALVQLLGLVTQILQAAMPRSPMGERVAMPPVISPLAPKPVEIRKPVTQAIVTSLQKPVTPTVTTYRVRPEMFAL